MIIIDQEDGLDQTGTQEKQSRKTTSCRLGMSVKRLADAVGVGASQLNEIVRGRRGISADTALRLARYFGTGAEFWPNLQSLYDLRMTERKAEPGSSAKSPRSRLPDLTPISRGILAGERIPAGIQNGSDAHAP